MPANPALAADAKCRAAEAHRYHEINHGPFLPALLFYYYPIPSPNIAKVQSTPLHWHPNVSKNWIIVPSGHFRDIQGTTTALNPHLPRQNKISSRRVHAAHVLAIISIEKVGN